LQEVNHARETLVGGKGGGIFRSLRILELAGELLAGYFFKGISGPQFISRRAFQLLQQKMDEDAIYWIHAADPASLCGAPLEPLKLPPRVAGTHLVYQGLKVVMVSRHNGKDLNFHVPPEDLRLPRYFVALRHLLTRPFQPLKRIAVATINGEKAPESPYVPVLRGSFKVLVDYKHVSLF
jgi:ATP-dependent Lhr-like helicase